jgi:predicted ATPase
VWGRLGRSVAQLPLLLVAAARPVPRRDEVDRLRRGLAGTDLVDLPLRPLDPAQVSAVVEGLVSAPPGPGLRELLGQAAGNPLHVRELVDALAREQRIEARGGLADLPVGRPGGPDSLGAAIHARLSFLSEPTTRVLRMAALLGAEFRLDNLNTVTGQPTSLLTGVIDEAMAAGVLAESGPTLAFRHGLIHEALYHSMPAAVRWALHQQAAWSLATAGARPETVAAQLLAAPDAADNWTAEWLIGAAPALIERAPQAAVDLLQRVRENEDQADDSHVELDVHLVDALSKLG